MTTGCTPIVLAIRNNHPDIVRELLSAGAIVPPPGITSDPLLLSILYPQNAHGISSSLMSPSQGMLSDLYQQQAFFPGQELPRGMYMHFHPQPLLKDMVPNSAANLPPSEVAKTIPCRNFPNCKYGSGCVFYHPRPQISGFYPANGYDRPFVPFPHDTPSAVPPLHATREDPLLPFLEQTVDMQHQSQNPTKLHTPHNEASQYQQKELAHAASSLPQPINEQHFTSASSVPSAVAAIFVPTLQTRPNGGESVQDISSPPPTSQFGISQMSPSLLAASLPSIPPGEAYFSTSPSNASVILSPLAVSNGLSPSVVGTPHHYRPSFNQPPYGMPGKSLGHGKKLSFSGIPRSGGTGRPSVGGGSWKDGNPPPCAFFGQGKCRNGEFCKFPHLDPEGNDCK